MPAERLRAQLLSGRQARSAEAVAERLLAVQAQDPRGFRLAVRARTRGLTAADVEAALADRSLVVTWLNRGTLHLVRAEDYWWLHALTTPPLFAGNARRLRQEGVSAAAAERGVATVVRTLASGPATRRSLREAVAAARVRVEGQALVHVLMLACLRGHAVRGPMAGREQAYVAVPDWLGRAPTFDRDAALGELARRYLAGHAPADERDLAKWAGLPLRDARQAFAGVRSPRPRSRTAATATTSATVPPRLLGAYDPVLLGWASREPVTGAHDAKVVSGGLFRPFALAGGRAVATWKYERGQVTLAPFGRLEPEVGAALAADAQDVARFLG